MQKYRYTVINPENKELTGTIGAPDEKSARAELNQLGFSIISIIAIAENEEATATSDLPKFEFSATDKNLKKVNGTIQAEDRYAAYKRLVKEYLLEVEYVIDLNLTEEEKVKERQKGAFELQNKLDGEALEEKKKAEKENFDFKDFSAKQQILQTQVDFVLAKVKELLDLYQNDLKPDTKEKIRKNVDKILRIKNSTNLDYIRKSCEELLDFLQQEEIFLHEELKKKEKLEIAMEVKTMMLQLHQKGNPNRKKTLESLREWRADHITNNEQQTFQDHFINFWIGFLIGFNEETPEMKEIRDNLAKVHEQIKENISIYFQAKEEDLKGQTRENIKTFWHMRKQLMRKLKDLKKLQKKAKKQHVGKTGLEKLSDEILSFSGWLLAFYLLYYFISLYLGKKDFGIVLPGPINIYHSIFLKYFLSILFLFHASLSTKINFFRRNEIATLVIVPAFLFGSLLIILNF
ncbi:MAG: hypothetical protein WC843_01705 [Candidatus Gracilibacteria bacterium]|jgi:hypothetical protein